MTVIQRFFWFFLFTLLAIPALANNHALILAISAYTGAAPPLAGVVHDVASAQAMARRMGVDDAGIRIYRDGELTVEGIDQAFSDLYERMAPGDQAFIYYSGHGARFAEGDRCVEALVSVNSGFYTDQQLERQLGRLEEKASKLVVFADACHSGGAARRSAYPGGISPKVFVPLRTSTGDVCSMPSNVTKRSLNLPVEKSPPSRRNMVYIAAARADQVSFDNARTGGYATVAWRDCLVGQANDRDGSGGLSAAEVRQCAQEKIDRALREANGVRPHQVTVDGNGGIVLGFLEAAQVTATAVPPPVSPDVPATSGLVPGVPGDQSTLHTESAVDQRPPAFFTLRDLYNNRDARRQVELRASKSAYRIGVDEIDFTLTSSSAGHVYLLMVGSDGQTFDLLFPNRLDPENLIGAGESIRLPRPDWALVAGGPAGDNHLLAIVADAPRDFSRLPLQGVGPFSVLAGNAVHGAGLQAQVSVSAHADSPECRSGAGKRTLQVVQRCSNAYGAAMLTLTELP